jgi:hypothetical protein
VVLRWYRGDVCVRREVLRPRLRVSGGSLL